MDDIYHRLVFDGRQAVHCYDCTDRSVDDAQAGRAQRRVQAVRHDRLPHRLGGGPAAT